MDFCVKSNGKIELKILLQRIANKPFREHMLNSHRNNTFSQSTIAYDIFPRTYKIYKQILIDGIDGFWMINGFYSKTLKGSSILQREMRLLMQLHNLQTDTDEADIY